MTTETKFTPGPWKARQAYTNGEPCGIVVDAGRETICETLTNDAVGEANARLIAAAPELLEALLLALEWSDDGSADTERGPLELEFRAKARDAIARAQPWMRP